MSALPKFQVEERRWIDAAYFLDTFGTDPVACEELVTLFQRVSVQQMAALAAAQAGSRWRQVAQEAHALKGSLGLFGARDTVGLLEELEEACAKAQAPAIRALIEELSRRMECIVLEVGDLRHP